MESIVNRLVALGFNKAESTVYLELLRNKKSTGYKIAQNTGISRAGVYQALDSLYSKGIIYLSSAGAKEYIAKEPKVLLKELENDYISNINALDKELEVIEYEKNINFFLNIEGYDNIMNKLKEMISHSKEEVYIGSNFGVEPLENEFIEARKRGVKIVFYSPHELQSELDIDIYYRSGFESVSIKNTRLVAVVDTEEAIIFDNGEVEPIGIYTNNKLFSKIICEHIHHDIYIARLIQKHGEIIDETIQVNSKHERDFKEIIQELKKSNSLR